jgi:hypothetical protein
VSRAVERIDRNADVSFSSMPSSPNSINADRYLVNVLRRARNRFIQHRQIRNKSNCQQQGTVNDNQSDSGVFTSSSTTNFNDEFESNSLLDIDDDHYSSIHTDRFDDNEHDDELLCQSLEVALMETLRELRQHRQQRYNSLHSNRSADNTASVLITRL